MKILALMTSALAENSAGRAVFNKVVKHSKIEENGHEYREILLVGNSMSTIESDILWSDVLIIVASPFHFGIQAQAKRRLFELDKNGIFKDKLTTFFLSSGGGGDQILEKELEHLFKGFGAKVVPGFSYIDYTMFENHGRPSDKTIRSGNNIDDMSHWLNSFTVNLDNIISTRRVLVVKATEDQDYFKMCKDTIATYYTNIEVLDITTMKLNECCGCKLCYTVKKQCIYKDKYLEDVAQKLASYKKIFYVANFEGEGMSSTMDNLVQRNVAYGLYPSHADPQCNVYMFKTNGASKEAIDTTRLHFEMLNSMEMNYFQIYFDDEFTDPFITSEPIEVYDEEIKEVEEPITDEEPEIDAEGNIMIATRIKRYVIKKKRLIRGEQDEMNRFAYDMARNDYQIEKSAFPNVTGWTRMYVRHFGRLINMIRNLLPEEYKFYSKHPMTRFVETDENVKPIYSPESIKTSAKFKIAYIEEFDDNNYNEKKSFSWSNLFAKRS